MLDPAIYSIDDLIFEITMSGMLIHSGGVLGMLKGHRVFRCFHRFVQELTGNNDEGDFPFLWQKLFVVRGQNVSER